MLLKVLSKILPAKRAMIDSLRPIEHSQFLPSLVSASSIQAQIQRIALARPSSRLSWNGPASVSEGDQQHSSEEAQHDLQHRRQTAEISIADSSPQKHEQQTLEQQQSQPQGQSDSFESGHSDAEGDKGFFFLLLFC